MSLDSSSLAAIPQELPQCCINRLSITDIFLQISFCSLYFQEGCSKRYFLERVKRRGGDRTDINWSASYVSSYIIDAIKNLGDKGLDKQQSTSLLQQLTHFHMYFYSYIKTKHNLSLTEFHACKIQTMRTQLGSSKLWPVQWGLELHPWKLSFYDFCLAYTLWNSAHLLMRIHPNLISRICCYSKRLISLSISWLR